MPKRYRSGLVFFACGLAIAGWLTVSIVQAQTVLKKEPIRPASLESGQEMYQAYCGSCHGVDAKGHGPAAAALKVPATDLTKLAAQRGGVFPALYVMHTLGLQRGTTRAHGSEDMPVWGDVFRLSREHDSLVILRLYSLTRYLESIQDPPPQAKPSAAKTPRPLRVTDVDPGSGSAMYRSYCASCHGPDGRGGGPSAATLKGAPPDLTLLAKNNNGKFPAGRVNSVLSTAPTTAHGSKQMPVWGDLLRASHEDELLIKLRISNIVSYLESLQQP